MRIKSKFPALILLTLTLIGLLLRFWKLASNPPSLNWDEVSHGYNAYSILLTGKDEWGLPFPLIFRAFGDYKLPIYIYLTLIPIKLFGLTPFAVRFVSALAGTLAIPGIYLLANEIFKRKSLIKLSFGINTGLLAAFLLAISPWHFFISRPALEANLALTLFIFGIWSLIKSIKTSKYWVISSILLSLTLHTYNSYRVVTPLALLVFVFIYRKQIKLTRQTGAALAIFVLCLGLVIQQFMAGTGTARYDQLTILSESAVFQIGQDRMKSTLPGILPRLLYNRPLYFLKTAAVNYFKYFTPGFLYQVNGAQEQFAIPGKNLLTLPTTLLSIFGVIFALKETLVKKTRNKKTILFLLLLLISPIPAALTASPPQALRPTAMIPFFVLAAAYAINRLVLLFDQRLHNYKKLIIWVILIYVLLICSIASGRYLKDYFTIYPQTFANSWQYGHKEVIEYINEHKSKYTHVFFNKRYAEPHIFYAFYSNLNPKQLQPNNNNIRFEQSDWFWTDKVENIFFVNDWQIPYDREVDTLKLESGSSISTKNSLIVSTLGALPKNTNILKVIQYPNGTPVFVIAKFK